ncbi:hypothetical protein ANN_13128 [Periplaneta americana]|uniref:Uncharacterized protein n=1 Tax=Periplaneta americana TaxID=6978 RepID=A0ABQ8TL38_PERAM|nr:hypothetical protein ANN_13128 [Periplaneta americana]
MQRTAARHRLSTAEVKRKVMKYAVNMPKQTKDRRLTISALIEEFGNKYFMQKEENIFCKPVLTRWETWLDAVNYYAEHYGKIMEVIDALHSTDSSAVAAVKSLPSEQLLEDILFIDSNFKIVYKSITLLESSKLQLSEALNIVYKVSQTVIQNNNSLISEKVNDEFQSSKIFQMTYSSSYLFLLRESDTICPSVQDRLKLKIEVTPNLTTLLTGHGRLNAYFHRFKIKNSATCVCGDGDQTVDHIIYDCTKLGKERRTLIQSIHKCGGKWPVDKTKLVKSYVKYFIKFANSIDFEQLQ